MVDFPGWVGVGDSDSLRGAGGAAAPVRAVHLYCGVDGDGDRCGGNPGYIDGGGAHGYPASPGGGDPAGGGPAARRLYQPGGTDPRR